MTDETPTPWDFDPDQDFKVLLYHGFKESIRKADPVLLLMVSIVTGLAIAYLIKRGLEIVIPLLLGGGIIAGVLYFGGQGLWALATNPPQLPPKSGLWALGIFTGAIILAVIGYFAERNGWMETDTEEYGL